MTTMCDEALAYALRGWRVFPLQPGEKRPQANLPWKDVATTDADTIRAWWAAEPAANIGLPCKLNGLVVVDMDRNHGDGTVDGINDWGMLLDSLGLTALETATLAAWTPNGGLHYVYQAPVDAELRGKLTAGIDIKHDGYIVAAPSVLPVGMYYWDDVPGAPTEPAPVPARLWEAMQKRQMVSAPVTTAPAPFVPPANMERWYQVALERECAELARTPVGNRNALLNKAAYSLGGYVTNGHLSASVVVDALMNAAHASGLVDQDGEASARATLRSGLTAGQRFPRNGPEPLTPAHPRPAGPADAPSPEPMEEDATPPPALFNRDAEMSVLGGVMHDPEQFIFVAAITDADDYYVAAHRQIFREMEYLWGQKIGIDAVTVADRLAASGVVMDMHPFLSCGERVRDITAIAEIVAEKATRRRLLHNAREIEKMVLSGLPADAIKEKAQAALFSLGLRGGRSGSQLLYVAADRRIAEIRELHRNPESRVGIDTGLTGLDNLTGGFRPGQFWVLAGDTGGGKTSLAMSMARSVAKAGRTVVMYSLEMEDGELYDRWQAMDGGPDTRLVQTGPLTAADMRNAEAAYLRTRALPIYIGDAECVTVAEIRADVQRQKSKAAVGLVIVDYLQLVSTPEGGGRDQTRATEIGNISRALKIMAKQMGVCVLALAQLNRNAAHSSRPSKHDIKDSSAIAQDANVVLVSYPKHKDDPNEELRNIFGLYIEKQRNGPQQREIDMIFTPHRTFFGDRAWEPDATTHGGR